ncbi:hypothetical protein [Streptomyces sp. NPDC101776]|uniref:hypothetical protein n=1 Tax=Streptomyces sp. NPDC101776 TaxID=3366146 RepID=UPI00381674DF
MNGPILIIGASLVMLALFVVAGVIDDLGERQPPARVVQPRRKVPLLPPPRDRQPGQAAAALTRGRHIRAARAQARARDAELGRPRPAPRDAAVPAVPRRPGV